MNKSVASSYYLTISLLLFFVSYIVFLPSQWMITDAYSYSTQAIAFASGKLKFLQYDFLLGQEKNLIQAPYSLGNSAYLAIFIFLFGKKYVFLSNLFAILFSAFFISKALKNWKLKNSALSIFFLSSPILFFSRSLMSCMPSLLIISILLYYFTKSHHSIKNLFLIGFLAAFSFWFRESNAIITGLLCLYLVYKLPSRFIFILLGGLAGLSIRLFSSYMVYGDPFFLSASAGFSISQLIKHLPLYLFITCLLVPFGLISVFYNRENADKLFAITSLIFILFYCAYSYTSVEYSGFLKGSLLTSRFIIPWIPIAIISFALLQNRFTLVKKINAAILIPLSFLLIPISQFSIEHLFENHVNASQELAHKYADKPLVYDQSGYTNIIRYINPLTGDWSSLADISSLEGFRSTRPKVKSMKGPIYVILSVGNESVAKNERSLAIKVLLNSEHSVLEEIIKIDPYNQLEVYRIDL